MTRTQIVRRTLQGLGLLLLASSLTGLGALYYVGHLWSGRTQFAPVTQTQEFLRVAFHPEEVFPGQTHLTILCMGLDRNWTNKGLPYTKKTRTDTMMVANLDLISRKVQVLSIPRDMRVEIPEYGFHKINDAYRFGEIPLTLETVNDFLDVRMDYWVLLKLGAVRRFVDAIDGVTLDVEKDMDYEDNWGQLFIHLKKGVQTLNGEQVEGYMRFRNDAESDFGRMRRQQQALKAILGKIQSPSIAVKVPQLIDAFSESIETNLRRDQILGLAHLFHEVRPEEVVAETLPGRTRMIDGVSYLEPMEERQATLVDWLLRGDPIAPNRLTTVRVLNGCDSRKTTQWVVQQLRDMEFQAIYAGRAAEEVESTRIEGHGRQQDAGARVAAALQVGASEWKSGKEEPIVTVVVGHDQTERAEASPPL